MYHDESPLHYRTFCLESLLSSKSAWFEIFWIIKVISFSPPAMLLDPEYAEKHSTMTTLYLTFLSGEKSIVYVLLPALFHLMGDKL
jgi:hypothetical protein